MSFHTHKTVAEAAKSHSTLQHYSNTCLDLITYPMEQRPQEANHFSASQEIPNTLWNRRKYITSFTRSHHLSPSWARSILSIPSHPTSWRSIYVWVFQVTCLDTVWKTMENVFHNSQSTAFNNSPFFLNDNLHEHSPSPQPLPRRFIKSINK